MTIRINEVDNTEKPFGGMNTVRPVSSLSAPPFLAFSADSFVYCFISSADATYSRVAAPSLKGELSSKHNVSAYEILELGPMKGTQT